MDHPEQHYTWVWDLHSPPDALWPLVSDTDRFNHDCGLPPVTPVPPPAETQAPAYGRRLRARTMGVTIEWQESAFEWEAPRRFGVERRYSRGPLRQMIVAVELIPLASGGTRLTYEVRLTPAGWTGRLAAPVAIGRKAAATFERVFRAYDELARAGRRQSSLPGRVALQPGAVERIRAGVQKLTQDHRIPPQIAERLGSWLTQANDLAVARMRPYAVARDWAHDRGPTLELFLCAARVGLLDFTWDLVCPHCRGAKAGPGTLADLTENAHCDTCAIDFKANFEQSVELTFSPSPAIRKVQRPDFCVGGPQITPHVLAQLLVPAHGRRVVRLQGRPGRYRVRTAVSGPQTSAPVRLDDGGDPAAVITLGADGAEPTLRPGGELTMINPGTGAQLAIVEHLAWTDLATTAAEVTALQVFRDLFSREVLRPGERIQVGTLTVVFTDLKNSTRMYREEGDAPAFGRVLTHFEILRACVAAEGGCVVKTMGDAVMAVFPRALPAVRAMVRAQQWLAQPDRFPLPAGLSIPTGSLAKLDLKVGLNVGASLAINQNDRLDYFGTTVNLAARLCAQSGGDDIVLSDAAAADGEVAAYLRNLASAVCRDRMPLKGLGEAPVDVVRLRSGQVSAPT